MLINLQESTRISTHRDTAACIERRLIELYDRQDYSRIGTCSEHYNQGDVTGAHPLSWVTVDRRAVTAVFLPTSFRKAAADRSVMSLVTCVTAWAFVRVSVQWLVRNTGAFLGNRPGAHDTTDGWWTWWTGAALANAECNMQ